MESGKIWLKTAWTPSSADPTYPVPIIIKLWGRNLRYEWFCLFSQEIIWTRGAEKFWKEMPPAGTSTKIQISLGQILGGTPNPYAPLPELWWI